MGQRDRVGARAPVRADLERHDRVAFGEIDVDELLDLVADEGDRRLALEMRGDAQLGLLARGVARLVERHDDVVGRVGARRARPADVEGDAGLFAVRRLHVEPMAAPADLRADLGRRVGADVDRSLGEPFRGLDRLVTPASVGIEPLVVVADRVERPGDAFAHAARAVGRDGDRLECRDVAFADRFVEILLEADRHALGAHRQRHDAFDRASAQFGDVDDDLRLERLGGGALRQIDGEVGVALVVGLDLVGELVLDGGELVVGQAADVTGIADDLGTLDRLEAHRAGDVEAGGRRAVEEFRVERNVDRLARRRGRLGGLQREIEALGDVILEQEFGVADARRLGIGVGVDLPFARRRVGEQRHGQGAAAEPLIGDADALVFDAVGTLDHDRQRQAGLGLALGVAQQRGDEHRLAGAIDAALGVEERVERAGRVAPADAAIGEIESVLRQIEEVVIVAERRHEEPRAPNRRAHATGRGRRRRARPRPSSSPPALRCCARRGGPRRRRAGRRWPATAPTRAARRRPRTWSGRDRRRPSTASPPPSHPLRRRNRRSAPSRPSTAAR